MQKQDEIYQKVEQFEKEIWYIVKTRLPNLKEEILSSVSGGSSEKLSEVEKKLSQLEESLTGADETLSALSLNLEALSQDVKSIGDSAQANSNEITGLKAQVQANTQEIEKNQQRLTDAEEAISSNVTKIQENQNRIQENESKIAKNTEDIYSNSTSIATQQLQIDENKSNIATQNEQLSLTNENLQTNTTQTEKNKEDIASLSSRITSLESSAGGGQGAGSLQVDVLYDRTSEDENINKGWAEGIFGSRRLSWTEDYDMLNVWGSLYEYGAFATIACKNNEITDRILIAAPTTAAQIYLMRILVNAKAKTLTVSGIAQLKYDSTTKTFERSNNTTKNGVVIRVEGVKI